MYIHCLHTKFEYYWSYYLDQKVLRLISWVSFTPFTLSVVVEYKLRVVANSALSGEKKLEATIFQLSP